MSAYSSPYDPKSSYSTLNGGINTPITASVLGHMIVLFLIIFGIPYVAKNPEVLYEPVPIEIISSSELAEELNPQEEIAEPEPPPPVERAPTMIEEAPPEPVEPEPVIEELVPEPVQPPPPIETPESEVEKEVEPEKPVMLPVRKPKPPPKKEQPKEVEKPKKDFNNLLNNLAQEEPEQVAKEQLKPEPTRSQPGIRNGVLSNSELGNLIAQLSQCWNIRAGAKYAEDLHVDLDIVVNTDRTVQSVKIVDQYRYNSDPAFRAAADAARRAVINPNCSPLDLPAAKYNEWKFLPLRFDPKDML